MNASGNVAIRWSSEEEAGQLQERRQLLESTDLDPSDAIQEAVLVYEQDRLVATGAYLGRVLRQIAVSQDSRSRGLTGVIVEALRKRLFEHDVLSPQVYTKPAHQAVFASLGFRLLASAEDAVLMECGPDALGGYINGLRRQASPDPGDCGCIVMNANPFTLGHRWLVEQALQRCDRLYIIVLEENTTFFPYSVRSALVRQGTADLTNCIVLGGGEYVISTATFPRYFIKKADVLAKAQAQLDVSLFTRHIAPALSLCKRFVGQEPEDELTRLYNETMAELLPGAGIEFFEFPRIQAQNQVISASKVRKAFLREDWELIQRYVPQTTLAYLQSAEGAQLKSRHSQEHVNA